MSPEIETSNEYSYKTDVWSAGCVVFELARLEKFKEFIMSKPNKSVCFKLVESLAKLIKMYSFENSV